MVSLLPLVSEVKLRYLIEMLHKFRGIFDVLRSDTGELVSCMNSSILIVLHVSHYNYTKMNYCEEIKVDGKKTY